VTSAAPELPILGFVPVNQQRAFFHPVQVAALCLALCGSLYSQDTPPSNSREDHAGYIPVITGGAGYVHNVNAGITTLQPMINPVLLVPFGSHVLLESRTDFTGFFQRNPQPDGPFKGKVFNNVEFAQLDWLANTHAIVVAGRYLLPFGLYNERLQPIWIKNLQDAPFTATIGTRTTGSGNGFQLRGTVVQRPLYSVQYTAYFSAHTTIHELEAARTAGYDTSVFFPRQRFEIGTSYQRFLEGRHINSVAAYLSWQPHPVPVDLKAEFDASYNGKGYWVEAAYKFTELQIPRFFQRTQIVARMQEVFPSHGGGNGIPSVDSHRFDFGLNYYIRDDLRIISSYGRRFSSQQNANVWNVGLTYRFMFPLWPARK
jgi:hypothetical protein